MNKARLAKNSPDPKNNYFEQCHRYWGNFEEIPVVRIRKNVLIPKRPGKQQCVTNRSPSPSKVFMTPEKIIRQNSVNIKKNQFSMRSERKLSSKCSRRSIVSIPSINFDYS